MSDFAARVADAFALPPATASPMVGSSQRLWRFDTADGAFVVKELPYDGPADGDRRERAAAFEAHAAATVTVAEPIPATDGRYVVRLHGSRDEIVPVRVHRWVDGDRVADATPELLRAVGASLRAIQTAGATWSTRDRGDLRWWHVDPREVAERVGDVDLALLDEGLALVATAEAGAGPWVFTHNDHKPENTLVRDGAPVVLDWDECGHCLPRVEAAESALRWSGRSRDAFAAFLDGYGGIDGLVEADFAKWVSALLGWFAFQARRALGDFPTDTADERASARAMADGALDELAVTLRSLPDWVRWGS